MNKVRKRDLLPAFSGGLDEKAIYRLLESENLREYTVAELFSMLVYVNKRMEYLYQLLDKGDIKPQEFSQSAIYKKFIEVFNEFTGSKYRGDTKTKRLLAARLKEAYTLKDIAQAVFMAEKDDFLMGRQDNTKKYLTPAYILRSEKLAEYLAQFEENDNFNAKKYE